MSTVADHQYRWLPDKGEDLTDLCQCLNTNVLEGIVWLLCDCDKGTHDGLREHNFPRGRWRLGFDAVTTDLNNRADELDDLLFLDSILVVECERSYR